MSKPTGIPTWEPSVDDFNMSDDEDFNEAVLEHFRSVADKFVPPDHSWNKCINCGSKLVATGIIDHVTGDATFEWGIVHGEGHCGKCGWPVKLYHFVKGKRIEAPLQYHPNAVSKKEDNN